MDRRAQRRARLEAQRRRRPRTVARAILFGGLALAIVGLTFLVTRPRELTTAGDDVAAAVDLEIRIDMNGFAPAELRVPAGRPVRVRIVNPDSSMHTDGGGVHGFTVPGLGIDVRVQPLTKRIVTIPAAPSGDYVFWCDTCCGGKENPTMQGHIAVRG